MRQGQYSDWLTWFGTENCKKVEASYLDALKQMIEHKSNRKYATIDDALNDFCSRMSIERPSTEVIMAAAFDNGKLQAVLASLKLVAINVQEIDKAIAQGVPSAAIANEFGNTDEEKKAVTEYVEGKAESQRQENSEIVRDMGRSDDQVRPTTNITGPAMSKTMGLRGLSNRI